MTDFRWLIHRWNHSLDRMSIILMFPFQLSMAGSPNPPPQSNAEEKSNNAAITPQSPTQNYLNQTFYDSVIPELPKVTHPLEYACIAYKVCTMSMRKLVGHSMYCLSVGHTQQINSSSWTSLLRWRKWPWSFGEILWGKVVPQTRWK